MPTRNEASKFRADFIRKRELAINSKINLLQENIFDTLIDTFLGQAKRQGLTKGSDASDIGSLLSLERNLKKKYLNGFPEIMRETINSARSIGDLNQVYFSTLMDSNRLDEIRDKTKSILDKRLGIDENGKVKPKGFVGRVIADNSVQKRFVKKVQEMTAKNLSLSEFQNELKNLIITSKERNGIVQQYYKTFASTLLANIDRSNNLVYADELELNHFIYGGGLIKSSRPMCLKNNGKIFTRDQAMKWKSLPEIKKMYGSNISEYDPLVDMGGYGCRHTADWITEELATGNTRAQNKKATERNEKFKKNNIK